MRVSISGLVLLCAVGCDSGSAAPTYNAPPVRSAAAAPPKAKTYGAPLIAVDPVPLGQVLRGPAEYADRVVTVTGTVRRNCTNKGCWMELAESMEPKLQGCRVTFKDYAFFVPLDTAGSTAKVQGLVQTQLVSAEEVQHMESEGGTFAHKRPDGSALEIRIVASGVELTRG
jgi:hypothetical protein